MIADENTKKNRLDTCVSCTFYRTDFTFLYIFKTKNKTQCGVCKCHIPTKVIFTDSKCPKGKW